MNDLELEVNLAENTLARPNISKAVCLNLSNSLRLSQERNRAILSTVDPNDSVARADTQRYFHLQAKIHELFIVLTDRIDQFPDPAVSSPPPSVPNPLPVKHNLPKISLPKFKGEFSEWENFWFFFSNLIHECTDLGNVIKYHYLLESLTDEPLELVKGLQVTEQNYETAIQWLKDCFENADKLKQMLIHKLNNLLSPRHTLVELKQFATLAKQLCTQINSVSIVASAEDHIKSTLAQKLPKSTYEQVVNHYGKFDFSLAELFKGIEFAVNLFEHQQFFVGESVTVRSASHKPQASGNKSSANNRKDSRNSSNLKNCQLCQGDHKPTECTKYNSRDSRRERVLKLNLCFNCLSAKHKSKFCKSKHSCRKCHNRHHTAICSDLVESGQRQSTRSVANTQHSNGSIANNSQVQGAISSEFPQIP